MDYVSEIQPHQGRLIGVGGYGRVYEGTWRGQRVAVKIMECVNEAEYKVRQLKGAYDMLILTVLAHDGLCLGVGCSIMFATLIALLQRDLCAAVVSFHTSGHVMQAIVCSQASHTLQPV